MRWAVDMHFLQGRSQGIKTYLEGLYEAVSQQYPDLELIFFFDKSGPCERSLLEVWKSRGEVVFLPTSGRSRRLAYSIAKAAQDQAADLLHVQAVMPLGIRCATLLTVHDLLFFSHPQYFSRRFALSMQIATRNSIKKAAAIVADSHFTSSEMLRILGVAEKVRVVHPGVNRMVFNSSETLEAREFVNKSFGLDKYILNTGRMDVRKNQETLVLAYEQLLRTLGYHETP